MAWIKVNDLLPELKEVSPMYPGWKQSDDVLAWVVGDAGEYLINGFLTLKTKKRKKAVSLVWNEVGGDRSEIVDGEVTHWMRHPDGPGVVKE